MQDGFNKKVLKDNSRIQSDLERIGMIFSYTEIIEMIINSMENHALQTKNDK